MQVDGETSYRYYAAVETGVTSSLTGGGSATYTVFKIGPASCFAGDLTVIPNFFNGNQASYSARLCGAALLVPRHDRATPRHATW